MHKYQMNKYQIFSPKCTNLVRSAQFIPSTLYLILLKWTNSKYFNRSAQFIPSTLYLIFLKWTNTKYFNQSAQIWFEVHKFGSKYTNFPNEQIPNILIKVHKFGSKYTNTKHQTVCFSGMKSTKWRGQRRRLAGLVRKRKASEARAARKEREERGFPSFPPSSRVITKARNDAGREEDSRA